MKMSIQTKYFLIAVVIIGSAGIWLPIGLELLINKKVIFHNIPANLTTYFISILFAGSIDYLLGKIRKISIEGIASLILDIIFIVLGGIALVGGAILTYIFNEDGWSVIIGIIGILISYRIWWIANIDNPNFSTDASILGGEVNKKLSNGN